MFMIPPLYLEADLRQGKCVGEEDAEVTFGGATERERERGGFEENTG